MVLSIHLHADDIEKTLEIVIVEEADFHRTFPFAIAN